MQHYRQPAQMNSIGLGVGRATRELRLRGGLSQERLAAATAVHRSFVFRLEKGEVNVSVDVLSRLAVALGVTMADYFALAERLRLEPTNEHED